MESLALETPVNCHSELMEDSLRNIEPVQLGRAINCPRTLLPERPQACKARGALAIPWKMFKARFASTKFWFAQKEQNRCHETRFTAAQTENVPKCDCGRDSAPDPAGGAYSAPQTP